MLGAVGELQGVKRLEEADCARTHAHDEKQLAVSANGVLQDAGQLRVSEANMYVRHLGTPRHLGDAEAFLELHDLLHYRAENR